MKKFVAHTAYCAPQIAQPINKTKNTDAINALLKIIPKLGLNKLFNSQQPAISQSYITPSIKKYHYQNTAKTLEQNREKTEFLKTNSHTGA